MNLKEMFAKARETSSYLLTMTVRDKTKTENDLKHFLLRKDIPTDNIVTSLDECVRSMGIKFEKPVDVVIPPTVIKDKKPLKIAFISHFNNMPESFAPARAARNQIKGLKLHGHDITFFLNERSHLTEEDLGCKVLKVIPAFHREKMIVNEEIKNKLINIFREYLTDNFDIVITYDFFIQDTKTFSEAIRQCGVDIPWLHFARSGVAHDMDFSMPNAKFVYLNYSDVGKFAKAIKVPAEQCRVIPNEKSLEWMFNFNPITRMIINKYSLWERDIIMTMPVCSSRFDAKGLDQIIEVFVELKRFGKKVALIVANANGKRRVDDLKRKVEFSKELGLNENEFIITSLLADEEYKIESELPNIVCAELMQLSNLMIMATKAEVSSNVLLEAAMTKQLLVLNSDLPCLYDAVNKDAVLSYPFTSNCCMHYDGLNNESLINLAKQIIKEIDNNKADLQFRHVWKNYNYHSLYYNIISPILYEDIKSNE